MSIKDLEIDPDKVALYIRWSTEDQGEGTTLDVQMEGCRLYAMSQGWHVHDDLIFIDDGFSGGSMDRPGLAKLRKLVQKGKVQCVVCYKLDRLSRSVVDTVNLVLEEWDDLCHVKSAREPIDTTTQAGKMFFYMLVSYAEWERAIIRDRTASGRLRRAQEGRWAAGKPPYGYAKDQEKRLVLHPEEAPIVARIFKEYLHGKGMSSIAYDLAAEGVPFREKDWRVGAVKRVLDNQVYCGDLIFGATRINPKWKKRPGEARNKRAEEPYVQIEGGAPAIVSREEFKAVQAMKRDRDPVKSRVGPRAYSSPHLLSAVAKCAKCGWSLIGYQPSAKGKQPVYYCRGHKDKGPTFCDCGFIRTSVLEAEVIGAMKEQYGSRLAQERFIAGMLADVQAKLEETRLAKASVSKALAKLEGEIGHVRKLLRANEISTQEYREMVADIEEETRSLREQLAEAGAREESLLAQQGMHAQLRSVMEAIHTFDKLPREQQKQVVGQLVKSLRVYKPKGRADLSVSIQWMWPEKREEVTYSEHTVETEVS